MSEELASITTTSAASRTGGLHQVRAAQAHGDRIAAPGEKRAGQCSEATVGGQQEDPARGLWHGFTHARNVAAQLENPDPPKV